MPRILLPLTLLALAIASAPSSAFEVLVEVESASGGQTIVGPYVYRRIEYYEAGGGASAAGGTLSADFRDGSIVNALRSTAASRAGARGIIADSLQIDVIDGAAVTTLDIPWRVTFDIATSLPAGQRNGLGNYRVRLLSALGSIDRELTLAEVFELPVDTEGRPVLEGTLTLPAADVLLSVYQIYVARLEAGLPATLDFSAALVFGIPDTVDAQVRGCSLLDYQSQFDRDADGIDDATDNCKLLANPAQADYDGDGIGNLCDGDLDNDGEVTPDDLALLRAAFFGSDGATDMNGDGVVNALDLGLLRAGFGRTPGPSCALPAVF